MSDATYCDVCKTVYRYAHEPLVTWCQTCDVWICMYCGGEEHAEIEHGVEVVGV